MIPLPKSKLKRQRGMIQIRLTPEENALFRTAANGAHLTISSWIRTRLWAAVKREKVQLDTSSEEKSE